MTEGLIVISVGCVVVMSILLLMVVLIELMVRLDHYLMARAKLARAARGEETSRTPPEIFAAIGMALHQFHEEQEIELAVLDRPRYSGWTSSGRLEIMESGQRLIFRR